MFTHDRGMYSVVSFLKNVFSACTVCFFLKVTREIFQSSDLRLILGFREETGGIPYGYMFRGRNYWKKFGPSEFNNENTCCHLKKKMRVVVRTRTPKHITIWKSSTNMYFGVPENPTSIWCQWNEIFCGTLKGNILYIKRKTKNIFSKSSLL